MTKAALPPDKAVPTHELLASGLSRTRISRMLAEGTIWRVRQGWYCAPGTHPDLVAAGRVGGTLTCGRALRLHRVWAPERPDLHVRVCGQARALRTPHDSRRRLDLSPPRGERAALAHWSGTLMQPRSLLAPLLDVLADVRRCMSVEDYLITLDSTLFSRPSLFAAVSRAGHPVTIGAIDGTGESGTETALWLRLRDHLPLRRQVTIPGVGRVDVLVGERLIIEVDSRTHHARTPDYERDRRRDARASVRGYRVLRFTYTQVFSHWPSVEAAIMAAYLRGDHL